MGIETAIAVAGLALSAGGTAMSIMGQQQQAAVASSNAQAQARAAQYQAQVAENNRIITERAAEDAIKRGKVVEDQRRLRTAQQIATQRAALASSGTDINVGTNVDIVGDTAMIGEFDALTIRGNAERESYGLKVKAQSYGAQGDLSTMQGRQYLANAESIDSNSWVGAGANLLAGASSVADKWDAYRRKGIGSGGTG